MTQILQTLQDLILVSPSPALLNVVDSFLSGLQTVSQTLSVAAFTSVSVDIVDCSVVQL